VNTLRIIPIVLLAGFWTGCGDPIKDAQQIEELRVLGGRAEVEGDSDRATPAPGETASVSFLVADPGGVSPDTVWSLAVCVAVETNYGVPSCRDELIATAEQETLGTAIPTIDFVVPDEAALGDAESLAVLGVICDGGTASAEAFGEAGCGAGQVTQRVSMEVFVGGGDAENHNPDLADSALFVDDELWESALDCSMAEARSVSADGKEHRVTLELTEAARELQTRTLDDVSVESLQISHFATGGFLERRFSNVAPETSDFSQELTWSAPKEARQGDEVSFFFVVRDQRGGISWLTRTLCLEP
jgi:hypothetical protein